MNYINYHKHTHYSNLRTQDSIAKPEDYMKRAKELGQTIYSTCEHGFQGNLYEAQTLGEKYGIKPIYAVEAYIVKDRHQKDKGNYHLMLVAMTKKGRYDINKIMSYANTDGYYYKPRIDMELLMKLNPNDVIVTSACVASPLFKEHFGEESESWLSDFFVPVKDHFGDSFYLEVQDHPDDVQIEHNKKILILNEEYGIKIIHGCDSHYIYQEDSKLRDKYIKTKGLDYPDEGGFILDYPDVDTIIKRYHQQGVLTDEQINSAINNTNVFENAEAVYTDKEFKIPVVPNKFIQEELGDEYDNSDNDKVLDEMIRRGWGERKKNVDKSKYKEYEDAIKYEEDIIHKCGMASYFVLNHIVTKRAVDKYNATLTRSGRGSAVSFLVNYMLGLTEVDRIKAPTKLYPSRFMSAERILQTRSLPDIDKNWADVEPIIRATKDVLGDDEMYYMIVYKPLQRSSAFRLWCKSEGYDINDYEEVGKMLSDKHNSDEDVENAYPEWEKDIEASKVFRGVIESMSPSPCSFLLSNQPISRLTGLIRVGSEDKKNDFVICSCLDGYNCDNYKFLKNDELIVKVYKLISETYKLIGRPIDDIGTLMENCDDKVWNLYAKGLTTTINQADSDFGKQLVSEYKPRSLREMAAFCAAIRPGFAPHLQEFIHREPMTTGVEELDAQLEDSYHSMLYQENIMTYLIWLGIPEKETYDIIKKISKKKFTEQQLDDLHKKLKEGWINKLGDADDSLNKFEVTWESVNASAKYAFNSSHSLSVAIDSIYGAYLKSHYPLEYFTVCFNNYEDDSDRTTNLTNELPYFGISLRSPVFRHSASTYSFDKATNTIYKGLGSIKDVGTTCGNNLSTLNDFQGSLVDLLYTIFPVKEKDKPTQPALAKKNEIDILIKIGYFEEFGSIKKLLRVFDLFKALAGKQSIKKDKAEALGLSPELIMRFAERESPTQFSKVNIHAMLDSVYNSFKDDKDDIFTKAGNSAKILGYCSEKDESLDWRYCVVLSANTKYSPVVNLYSLGKGNICTFKFHKKKDGRYGYDGWNTKPLDIGDVIYLNSFSQQFKRKKTDDGWVSDPNIKEWWCDRYTIIQKIE